MSKFKKDNPELELSMKSHLINDLNDFGIWEDDYDAFFENRAKLVNKELKKRLIKQEVDRRSQPDIQNDYEEEPTVTE